jgi:hypothetical protein
MLWNEFFGTRTRKRCRKKSLIPLTVPSLSHHGPPGVGSRSKMFSCRIDRDYLRYSRKCEPSRVIGRDQTEIVQIFRKQRGREDRNRRQDWCRQNVHHCGFVSPRRVSLSRIIHLIIRLSSGKIKIDGVDISEIGLNTLRSRIAIIPQEPVLFSGTLRSNLDPFDSHGDDVLHDAMKRACLTSATSSGQAKTLSLDTEIEDEGTNLSRYRCRGVALTVGVGQRSLVSLARALVKNVRYPFPYRRYADFC